MRLEGSLGGSDADKREVRRRALDALRRWPIVVEGERGTRTAHDVPNVGWEAGGELAVMSTMLAHAEYSTTVDVYSHLSPERSKVAAARIDGLVRRRA